MTQVDSALLSLLSLNPDTTTISSAGGGGGSSSARTSKLTTKLPNGTTKHYFLKASNTPAAKVMFAGEHLALQSIHSIVPTLCPKSYGHGEFQDPPNTGLFFLVTDFLNFSTRSSKKSGQTLAQKLATLHTTPAPIPPGYTTPQFGFLLPTCCGDTQQPNTFTPSWADFFSNHRLQFILDESLRNNGKDPELTSLIHKTCETVIPNLISDSHLISNHSIILPVLIHGDLWSGNTSPAILPDRSYPEDVIFDSAAFYAHSEYEIGIMRMFGGFGEEFWEEYHSLVPKMEPVREYEDRVRLYEVYHQLNHYAMFGGGGYRSGGVGILRDLIGKYSKERDS